MTGLHVTIVGVSCMWSSSLLSPATEWYLEMLAVKYRHQKDTYYNVLKLLTPMLGSPVWSHNDRFKRNIIFTLISYEFRISTLHPKFDMTIYAICSLCMDRTISEPIQVPSKSTMELEVSTMRPHTLTPKSFWSLFWDAHTCDILELHKVNTNCDVTFFLKNLWWLVVWEVRQCQLIEHNNVTNMALSLSGNLECHIVDKRI